MYLDLVSYRDKKLILKLGYKLIFDDLIIINIFVLLSDKCKADHTTSQQPEKEAPFSNPRVSSNNNFYEQVPKGGR